MDDACRLRGLHTLFERPGAALFRACRQEGLQIQQLVGRFDKPVDTRLLQSQVFKEHLFLLVRLQLGNVGLDAGTDHQHLGLLVLHGFADHIHIFVATYHRRLVDIAHIQYRFGGQQHKLFGCLLLVLVKLHCARAASCQQGLLVKVHHLYQTLGLRVAAGLGLLLLFRQTVLYGLQILELQLKIDRELVAHWVDRTVHVRHIVVVEAAQHVDDGIRGAYVAQELVAQSLAFRGTFDQTGYIHYLDRGRHHTGRMLNLNQFGQTLVGNGNHAHIGLYRAERKIGSLGLGIAQAVEKR